MRCLLFLFADDGGRFRPDDRFPDQGGGRYRPDDRYPDYNSVYGGYRPGYGEYLFVRTQ